MIMGEYHWRLSANEKLALPRMFINYFHLSHRVSRVAAFVLRRSPSELNSRIAGYRSCVY